ncbi:sensor histidine kinase [Nocardia jiangsuensis]|uniref:histidine kinase n=1 Tax=Nocardia jiangsuensis TaxID=1691563 RepID=A0ABV8E117_9NOCA
MNTRARGTTRLTVETWFQLVLGSMVVIVLAGAVAGASMIARTTVSSTLVIGKLQPALAESYRLQAALIDQENGVRGYAIGADSVALRSYGAGRDAEVRALSRLRGLLADRPDALADLAAVEASALRWRTGYAETVTAAPERARAAAADGRQLFDAVRAGFTGQADRLAVALDTERTAMYHNRDNRNLLLGGLVVVFVLAAVLLTVLVRGLVVRPLAELQRSSLRVAGGDFEHRIAARGPADIATVGAAVEDMRRRIVTELRSAREQEATLVRQAADLDAQTVELRRSNQELEQFAYVASHDLQEPLRKVASFCQLLQKRYDDELDDRGRQYIEFAVDGAKRMQVLITDLLTFSRVGRVNDRTERLELDPVLDRALHNLGSAIAESGATVQRPERLPAVVGDPTLLEMLWQNLLGNAVKFAAPGRKPEIVIEHEERDGTHHFAVRDTGIGVPPEFADKVFVIFQRLHNREEYGGTGLGLAICRKIVEFHGGRIELDTEYTGGARFRFTVPVAAG